MASPPRPLFYGEMGVPAVTSTAQDSIPQSSHSSSSSSIIIWVVSLTVIFAVSFCLFRCLRRRYLSRSSTSAITTTATSAAASNRVRPEEISPTTESLIDSLPLFTFSSIISRSKDDSMVSADCPVCLSKFEPEDQLRLLPLCCHAFHAHCIDTWLTSNQSRTCPLCRSPLFASDSDLMKALVLSTNESAEIGREGSGSFQLELVSVSRRQPSSDSADHQRRTTYSVGSIDYVVDQESEVTMDQTLRRNVSDKEEAGRRPAEPTSEASLAAEVANDQRGWLKEYVDRISFSLSSSSSSFSSSGRFFTGSSRRSDNSDFTGEYDVEANRIGEEISEMFRWFSGV